MTNDAALKLSVISAPVASVDRRTLSTAWYSALYHAHQSPNALPQRGVITNTARKGSCVRGRPQSAKGFEIAQRFTDARNVSPSRNSMLKPSVERRARPCDFAVKLERVLTGFSKNVRRAAIQIDAPRGRVQIVVAGEGSRVRLVAICSKANAPEVARALQYVRYKLATRGIRFESRLQSGDAC